MMWTSKSSQAGPQLRLVSEREQYANAPSAVQGETSYLPTGGELTGVAGIESSCHNSSGCHVLQQIEDLETCHQEHPIAKFWGTCNDQKYALDRCFRQEKALNR